MISCKDFRKERDEALLSLSEVRIRAFANKHDISMPYGILFWITVHTAIINYAEGTQEQMQRSKKWLQENGRLTTFTRGGI